MSKSREQEYWKSNLRIVSGLLCIWFFISFGCGILLVDFLDQFRVEGFKLGFWIAQQGAIYVFVVLVYLYIHLMDRLDRRYLYQTGTYQTLPGQTEDEQPDRRSSTAVRSSQEKQSS